MLQELSTLSCWATVIQNVSQRFLFHIADRTTDIRHCFATSPQDCFVRLWGWLPPYILGENCSANWRPDRDRVRVAHFLTLKYTQPPLQGYPRCYSSASLHLVAGARIDILNDGNGVWMGSSQFEHPKQCAVRQRREGVTQVQPRNGQRQSSSSRVLQYAREHEVMLQATFTRQKTFL
ncbi:hypothetical protein EMCRGX_G005394 [Ephydatia muelleri]